MEKYKEVWISPIDSTVIAHIDTETNQYIPIDLVSPFQDDFQAWVDDGNTPDPAYTTEQITAYQENQADLTVEEERKQGFYDEQTGSGMQGITVDEAKQVVIDRIDIVRALPEATLAEIQAKISELCDQTEWLFKKVVVFLLR